MNKATFGTDFQRLDNTLTIHQPLWRPQPFTSNTLPWQTSHPALHQALLDLDEDTAYALHNDAAERLRWFTHYEPALCDTLSAFSPSATMQHTPIKHEHVEALDIPGGKWQQIIAFASALPNYQSPLVDWCAGKGHLSRIVQRSQQQAVHCLEWNKDLVDAGKALAQRGRYDIHYHHHDVLTPLPADCCGDNKVHIGLHACGQLHIALLKQSVQQGAHAIALSPCCYHKVPGDQYQPLSTTAQASDLKLSRRDLHLAVQDTVTARQGERKLRELERWWRLGFDSLQRELRNTDEYLNVPSCKRSILREDFRAFCQWAAAEKNITLPEHVDYARHLEQGRIKHRQVFRLELLRRLFNRPLELWLALDKALYLQEQGYKVSLKQFCDAHITPRNLLIQAQK